MHLAYNAPHYPLQARAEDIARYRGRYAAGYEAVRRERWERLVKLGVIKPEWPLPPPDRRLGEMRNDYGVPPWKDVDPDREAELMEIYAAMVESMDRGIGRVLDALRECGVEDNTVVLFFSDNGGCAGLPVAENMGPYFDYNAKATRGGGDSYLVCGPGWGLAQSAPFRRYKTSTHEGGIATPLIVRWPGHIKPDTWTDAFGHVVDLMPTFLELAGAEYPATINGRPTAPMEGFSFAPVLGGGKADPKREQGWYIVGNRAYRKGKWKIVWGTTSDAWELYDMEADRTEVHDLAAAHPEIVADLSAAWNRWSERSEVADDVNFWILPKR